MTFMDNTNFWLKVIYIFIYIFIYIIIGFDLIRVELVVMTCSFYTQSSFIVSMELRTAL